MAKDFRVLVGERKNGIQSCGKNVRGVLRVQAGCPLSAMYPRNIDQSNTVAG